jgi:multiple sugar transport system substrate-binding protein
MLALLLAALIVFGACAAPTTPAVSSDAAPSAAPDATAPAPAGDAAGSITIGFAASEFERESYAPLIAAFNAQNSGVQVQFVALNEGPVTSIDQLMRQAVSAADTAAAFFLRPEDIKNGLVRDLKPLIDGDSTFDRGDFYPGALEAASLNDGIYMLPRTLHLTLLSYNKDLWARRGLPPPQPNWTWSDLLGTAAQLAEKRGDTVDVYGLAESSGGAVPLAGLLAEAGVPLAPVDAAQLRLDRPEVSTALNRVAELAKSGAVSTNAASGERLPPNNFLKLIAEQQVAMWFDAPMVIGPDVPKPAFPIGIAALPQSGAAGGGAEGYVISAGTAHPEAAWRWLSFLSRQEIRRPFMEGANTGMAPARKSLAERSGYWKQLDADAQAAVQATIARAAAPATFSPNEQLMRAALAQALAAVVGGQPAARALADAQATLDKQIAEAAAAPSPTPDAAPLVVATPAPSGPAPGATALTFKTPLFQANQFRELASAFNAQHPELFVQLESVRLDEDMTLARMADGADCFSWPDPAEASAISGTLDLQPLVDAEAGAPLLDDYPAALLAPFKRGGALYGLPYQVRLRALTYNQTAFDAAGLQHPSASWSADDLLNAAEQLTSGEGGDKRYGYAALGSQTDELLLFLDLLGARAVRDGAPNFADPAVVQGVRSYLDLLREHSPHTHIQGYTRGMQLDDQAFQLVDEGRVGMWFDLPGGMVIVRVGPDAAGRQSYTRAIAPPPGAARAAPGSIEASGLYISATAQQPDACWQWLKFLSQDVTALAGNFPARRSLAESDAFLKQAPLGAAEVYAAYKPALDRVPEEPQASEARAQVDLFWFFRAADRALAGKDLERELADAQALTGRYLNCVQSGGAPAECAKQVDSTYEGFAE